jgi:hypothetical protein
MHIYIIVEDEGSYSDREWRIVDVLKDKTTAIKTTWVRAMDEWQNDYHVQEWDLDNNELSNTYHINTFKLRQEWTSSFIAELQEKLQTDAEVPELLLETYTVIE